jgi:hypothetical protein
MQQQTADQLQPALQVVTITANAATCPKPTLAVLLLLFPLAGTDP